MALKGGIQAGLSHILTPVKHSNPNSKNNSPIKHETETDSVTASPVHNGVHRKGSFVDNSRNALETFLTGDLSQLEVLYPAYGKKPQQEWSPSKNGVSPEMVQGEKNHGFDVLYHNMKHGQISVKYLQDFIRESAVSEDLHAKHLMKLAKQAANSSTLGSFAPMFEVFRTMAEKLSSCHNDVVHKLQEIIKDLSKYLEDQKGKHKQVKDGLSGTADALHQIQTTTAAVHKSKEKYHQLCMETERLKRSGVLQKDVEKSESKMKKAIDEYKGLVAKHATVRNNFENKMTESAKRFQEIEVAHLKHMKSFLDSYILSFENANILVGQVHQEFRRQVDENTIDSLIKKYCDNKGTGTEKPSPVEFELCDVDSMLASVEPAINGGSPDEGITPPPVTKGSRRLPFLRRRKVPKESAGSIKDADKDAESIESPDKESQKIDEEGYTIRPETPKGSKNSFGFDSSDDSDSDDDYMTRKIRVKINPKTEQATVPSGNIDALNQITRNLTLNSPTARVGKGVVRRKTDVIRSVVIPRRRRTSLDNSDESEKFSSEGATPERVLNSSDEDSHSLFSSRNATPDHSRSSSPSLFRCGGNIQVLPALTETLSGQETSPVPAPRRMTGRSDTSLVSARKKSLNAEHRFSTAFVPYWDKNESDNVCGSSDSLTVAKPETQEFNNQAYVGEGSWSSDGSHTAASKTTAERSDHRVETDNATPRRSLITAKVNSSRLKVSSPSLPPRLSLKDFVSSAKLYPRSESTDLGSPVHVVGIETKQPERKWAKFDDLSKNTTNSGATKKPKDFTAAEKTEKTCSDELLDLFGNNSTAAPRSISLTDASRNNNNVDLSIIFGSSSSLPPKKEKLVLKSSISESSSDKPPNNIFMMQPEKERNRLNPTLSNNENHIITGTSSELSTARPNNLSLLNMRPDTLKVGSTISAPLTSSESWSSLSSFGGTPMDSFASSRGPSPLTLMQGDPIPIAAAFTETVHAYFKGSTTDRCMVKITGEVQISFPAGIIRAFTSNPNPSVLSFKVKGTANIQDFAPNPNLLFADLSHSDVTERLFWFNMTSLISYIKKMTENNPNAPYYNVQVLTYQMTSSSGYDIAPLHISAHWNCDVTTTDITIDYKYNSQSTSTPLKNLQILVPVNGGVVSADSVPQANWIPSQNRVSWKLPSAISNSSPSGSLKSKLSLSSGPSTSSTLAVQFISEGSTLTGADFELTGSGYRLSLVKKRFVSGKYLSDGS